MLCGFPFVRRSIPYTLDCHHIVFRSQGGVGEPKNLAMLCGPVTQTGTCHHAAHSERAAEIRKILQGYIEWIYKPKEVAAEFDIGEMW
ncbi:HNH endonuclease [Brevibacillus migulae]|uniref:HNH endonuclease n=1 Tax=Brevibacillus migulae TaxID=1644114 RepID=UPI00143172DF